MFESGRIEFEDDGETSRLRLIRTGKTSDPISLTDSKWFRAARHSHLCETSFPPGYSVSRKRGYCRFELFMFSVRYT